MSEKFYEKLLNFFWNFAILMVSFMFTVQFLIFYYQNQNWIFYFGYVGMLLFSGIYGIHYYLAFRDFKANLSLFIPNIESQNSVEPLNMELEDKSLKVCLYYRNGATYEQIQKDLDLAHPTQVKRELQKGLSFLLRYYNEHEAKT